MTLSFVFSTILYVSTALGIGIAIAGIIGVAWQDIKQSSRETIRSRHPYARAFRRRPLVTVVVDCHDNDIEQLATCLLSLTKNRYRKIQVIVYAAPSQRAVRSLVRGFHATRPTMQIDTLIGKGPAGLARTKRLVKGELILAMPATSQLGKNTLHQAIARFNDQPRLQSLALNSRILNQPTILGLGQRLVNLALLWTKKAGLGQPDTSVMMYRKALVEKPLHGMAMDAVVSRQPITHYEQLVAGTRQALRRQLSWLALNKSFISRLRQVLGLMIFIVTACQVFLATYLVYVALALRQPGYLMAVWALFMAIVAAIIWTSRELSSHDKFGLSFYLPMSYLLFLLISSLLVATMIVEISVLTVRQSAKIGRLLFNRYLEVTAKPDAAW